MDLPQYPTDFDFANVFSTLQKVDFLFDELYETWQASYSRLVLAAVNTTPAVLLANIAQRCPREDQRQDVMYWATGIMFWPISPFEMQQELRAAADDCRTAGLKVPEVFSVGDRIRWAYSVEQRHGPLWNTGDAVMSVFGTSDACGYFELNQES